MKNPVDITPKQLAHEVTQGKTFVPAYIATRVKGVLARRDMCWTSQQIVALDFDNSIYNSKLKKTVKDIKLTWDQAKQEFIGKAMFMYKTFSYKDDWPKFRVVFAYSEPFTNINIMSLHNQELFNSYPYVDESTFQPNRLFFGGYDLHVFDYANRLPVHDPQGGFYDLYNFSYNIDNNIGAKTPLEKSKLKSNLPLIINRDKSVKQYMNDNYPETICCSTNEAFQYLKKINLHDYLGIHSKTTFDIFHTERNPSASIYKDPSTGYWWYKCWSANHPWKGTIIDVTERLTGLSNSKSFRYLMEVFNIKLMKSDWQQEQEEIFNLNKQLLLDEFYIEEAYPNLYSIIRSPLYYSILRELHDIAIENIHNLIKQPDGSAVFFASIHYIMHRLNRFGNFEEFRKRKEKWFRTAIPLLVYLGLVQRVGSEHLPSAYIKKAKSEASINAKDNGFQKKLITFFSLPSYDAVQMIDVEELAKQFKELGMTIGNFDRQMVVKTLGVDETDRIFPERKGEKLSELNESTCRLLEETLIKYIDEFGYATEEKIILNTHLSVDVEAEIRKRDKKVKESDVIDDEKKEKWLFEFKKRQLKKQIGGLLTKYNLKRETLSNRLMEEQEIPIHYNENGNQSFPKVIYKDKHN
ncbi:hypothetical protein MHB54_28000 [Paenibacillus sp. FSL M7-0802]|uniref:hypothetical protein n=1 Tax=Paenibacillus sp. FSL M7-0802 TaxID=2921536 RepID=UPI0030F5D28A